MSEDTISAYYNRISRSYDTGRVASTETIKKLVRLLSIGNDSIILDMGCGTGNYIYALQPMVKSIMGEYERRVTEEHVAVVSVLQSW